MMKIGTRTDDVWKGLNIYKVFISRANSGIDVGKGKY